MVIPNMLPRMEKWNVISRSRIDARKIWSFVEIAPATRPTKVLDVILSAVLLGNNMLQMERPLVDLFRKMAVFAPTASPLPHEFSIPLVHALVGMVVKELTGLRLQQGDQIASIN